MSHELHDFIGAFGSFLIIACYLLIQVDRMSHQSLAYSVLNGFGAALILYSLYFEFNFAAVVIESFWVLISILGVVKWLRGPTGSHVGNANP